MPRIENTACGLIPILLREATTVTQYAYGVRGTGCYKNKGNRYPLELSGFITFACTVGVCAAVGIELRTACNPIF